MARSVFQLIILLAVLIYGYVAQQLSGAELEAFRIFNASLSPPNEYLDPSNPCSLSTPGRIQCDTDPNTGAVHVTLLEVREQTAEIGDWIKNWPYLTEIRINNVTLTKPLSVEIASLPALNTLDLWTTKNLQFPKFPDTARSPLSSISILDSDLSGEFPDLRPFINLTGFVMRNTQVSGTIPSYLGSMTQLEGLAVSKSPLTGTIPTELKSLKKLTYISFSDAQLTGTIPPELELPSLIRIFLQNNQLTGTIPWQLAFIPKLDDFRVNNNQLTGTIPPEMAGVATLRVLNVANNLLTGKIPDFSGLQDLTSFNVSNNPLSGCYNTTLRDLLSCDVTGTNLCCIPSNPICNTTNYDCVTSCPQPAPASSAVCQVDKYRQPVWYIYGTYAVPSGSEIDNLVVVGNMTVSGPLKVTDGDLIVYGCAIVSADSSLSFKLSPAEISDLGSKSSIERTIFTFDSICGTSNLNFGSITVDKGDLQSCIVLKTKQNNTPESVTVTVTKDESGCKKTSFGQNLMPALSLLAIMLIALF